MRLCPDALRRQIIIAVFLELFDQQIDIELGRVQIASQRLQIALFPIFEQRIIELGRPGRAAFEKRVFKVGKRWVTPPMNSDRQKNSEPLPKLPSEL